MRIQDPESFWPGIENFGPGIQDKHPGSATLLDHSNNTFLSTPVLFQSVYTLSSVFLKPFFPSIARRIGLQMYGYV